MFFESFESRTLMSADPNSAVNATIVADRAQIHADLLKFRSDALSAGATISTDLATLQADGVFNDSTLVPLFQTLKKDVKVMRFMLKGDRLEEANNVLKDELKICTDRHEYKHDHGDAHKNDKHQLRDDHIKMQQDEIAGLNARLTTRQDEYTKIMADLNAIGTAAQNDPNASDQMKGDIQTFVTDGTNALNTMATDIQKLITDRTQLVNDLTAIQSQT
jgi:hypothetical protein